MMGKTRLVDDHDTLPRKKAIIGHPLPRAKDNLPLAASV
jgi:hypothetical protein